MLGSEVNVMLLKEITQLTGLTRKAVKYYAAQGLITPIIKENGYREFSETDAERLRAIAAYRALGISVPQIRELLDGNAQTALGNILLQRTLRAEQETRKNELLNRLAQGAAIEDIMPELSALRAQETIATRLAETFPGYLGQYLCVHFASFLAHPIQTDEQRAAYDTIVAWLDALAPISLPEALCAELDEATCSATPGQMADMSATVRKAIENPQAYFAANRETIKAYLEIRESEAYKASPAAQLTAFIREFQQQSGYEEVFLLSMERLSPEYAAYRRALKAADRAFEADFG